MAPLIPQQLRAAIEPLPRLHLAHLPTPLEPMARLSAALGDVELWVKRDDTTGLALGGNKTRQLEFTLGEALARHVDCVVQGADAQSNHCRQTAAAAARLGLECHLVLRGHEAEEPVQGNLLLDRLFGARLHWTDAELGPPLEAEKEALAERLRQAGRCPYVIGGERGKRLGAVGYALAVCELAEQLSAAATGVDYVYVCSAGPTHAGLLLGTTALGLPWTVQAISPIVWPYDVPGSLVETANGLAEELGIGAGIEARSILQSDDFVGAGYGIVSREARVAIELVARTEGLLLDGSYTGKAMAGLIDHVRRGVVRPGSRVVFIHTGGIPAIFRQADVLSA
jgi:D-cysteine desulfhydrase family pyridoxal phosphate-dependent enzyme